MTSPRTWLEANRQTLDLPPDWGGSEKPTECWCGTDEALAAGEQVWIRLDRRLSKARPNAVAPRSNPSPCSVPTPRKS